MLMLLMFVGFPIVAAVVVAVDVVVVDVDVAVVVFQL